MIRQMLAALFGLVAFEGAGHASPLPFVLTEVGPGVYAATDGPQHKAGSNAGFVIGDDGVLVIDAFFNLEAARALVLEIHRLTSKPIRYVVNTHYHVDHTGGDQALRDAGALILAHRNVRSWVRSENVHLLGDRITPEVRASIAALPLPDIVIDNELTIWLGSRRIVVKPVLGHTGGDLTVFVPDAQVLFAGDLLWRKIAPNLIDGSVKEWTATDAGFAAMRGALKIRFVPGHGEVANLADVKDFRTYLLDLERLVAAARGSAIGEDALIAAVAPRLKALHPDWSISDRAAAAEVHYMNQELAGTKRRPVPAPQ